jgi:hypothetical protein
MSVQFLSNNTFEELKQRVPENQEAYISGQAATLLPPLNPKIIESRIQADAPPTLVSPTEDLNDGANARLIFSWLSLLTPVQAADPRLWSYLTHANYADYTSKRWPIDPSFEVVTRIRERYFIEGQGLASLVRNAIARLWWFGYLTYDDKRSDHFELTDVLVSLQDIQVAFLERAIGRSQAVLRSALQTWKERLAKGDEIKGKGTVVKNWAKLIRLHGAVALLDSLPARDLDNLVRAKLAAAMNEEWTEAAEETSEAAV